MKKILNFVLMYMMVYSPFVFSRGKLQNEDFKTSAELVSAGGTAAQLLNDSKVYVTGGGINNTLDYAINNNLIGGGGGITFTAKTADYTMTANAGFIANKTSGGALVFTLPATCSVGDQLAIAGQGSQGWEIYSNASATSQRILFQGSSTAVSSSSAIRLTNSISINDSISLVCVVANDTWVAINTIGCAFGNNWGTGADGDVSSSGNITLTNTTDGDAVVKNYHNLTINSGHTLTTSSRVKALVIYATGKVLVKAGGKISMTARGASVNPVTAGVSASGLRLIRLTSGGSDSLTASDVAGTGSAWISSELSQAGATSNGTIITVARTGANGGAQAGTAGTGYVAGNVGSNGTAGQSGGGGTGGVDTESGAGGSYAGKGGNGTCFSGGPGSGGDTGLGVSGVGSDIGGAGGAGLGPNWNAGGGAGNPGGARVYYDNANNGTDGTGGLLVIIAKGGVEVESTGIIESKGSNGGNVGRGSGGGASGGGNIVIIYANTATYTNAGTVSVAGGIGGTTTNGSNVAHGGDGGTGSIQTFAVLP